MEHSETQRLFAQLPKTGKLRESIAYSEIANKKDAPKIHLKGLLGSALSFVLAEDFKSGEKPFLLIFDDNEEAAYHLNDLEQLLGKKDVLFYPGSYRRPYQLEETDNANVLLRSEVVNRINSRKKPALIVTYPDALFEKTVTKKELEKNTLKISVGDNLSIDFVNEALFEYKFNRVDFVSEPGEFSVRGGIIDVFSFSHDEPFRIEFFGDEVESIRKFDVETQLSTNQVKKITVIPNLADKQMNEVRESFLEFIPGGSTIFLKNADLLFGRLDDLFKKAEESFEKLSGEVKHSQPTELFCDSTAIKNQLSDFILVEMGEHPYFSDSFAPTNKTTITYVTRPQPAFHKHFNLLMENLLENSKKGYKN